MSSYSDLADCCAHLYEQTRRTGIGALGGDDHVPGTDPSDYTNLPDVFPSGGGAVAGPGSGGFWDTFTGAIKNIFGGASKAAGNRLNRAIDPAAYGQALTPPAQRQDTILGLPSTVVYIGGAAIGALLLLKLARK